MTIQFFYTREQVEKVVGKEFDEELFDLCRDDNYVEIFIVIQQRLFKQPIEV